MEVIPMYVPPKRRVFSELHVVPTQPTAFFRVTAIKTSNARKKKRLRKENKLRE
jgi:hypothetical protein